MANELVERPDLLPQAYDYGEDTAKGFENQTGQDYQVPFLSLLQDMSPQVTGAHGSAVEGARAGMMYNTVTQDLYDGDVLIVPALTEHVYVEWIPREQGGGFVGAHPLDSEMVAEAKRVAKAQEKSFGDLVSPDGNDIVETFYVYGVLCPEDQDPQPVVIAFTSTKIRVYKQWMSKIRMFTVPRQDGSKARPPLFAHLSKISTVRQTNKKGTFFNFQVGSAGKDLLSSLLSPDDVRFKTAKGIGDLVNQGFARASYETQNASTGDVEDHEDY